MGTNRAARFAAGLLILALLLSLPVLFSSCGKDKKETPLGLVVVYMGEDVYETDHVFSPDDFTVLASYADGRDEYVHDFEFEQTGLEQGFYIFRIAYCGCETEAYVRCSVPVYPSDLNPEPEE